MQTDFIPKSGLTASGRPVGRPVGLLWVIAFIAMGVSLAFFGGSYLYQRWLDGEINRPCQETTTDSGTSYRSCGLIASVGVEEKTLDRGTILLLQRLDQKFKIAEEIINQHQTIIPIFDSLQNLTLPSVRYTRFGYNDRGLTLEGKATSYEDVAVQSKVFADHHDTIGDFIFSDLDLDAAGQVGFKLAITVAPDVTSYTKHLNL